MTLAGTRGAAFLGTFALVAMGAANGCGGSTAAALRPEDPSAAKAMNESACPVHEQRLVPLIVDWKPFERSELEASMRESIAVVAYTCDSIRVLPDCHVDGTYRYVGVTRKEEVVKLVDADELRANLPRFGANLGVELKNDLARGASLDVGSVLVGQWRTTRLHTSKVDLSGQCDGATHIVRGAHVGAFVMDVGTRARVQTAAALFDGGGNFTSTSERVHRTLDGDRASCENAGRVDLEPPSQCGALLRIELVSIDAKASSGAPGDDPDAQTQTACPHNLVWNGSKCVAGTSKATYVCRNGDPQGCAAQCDRGNPRSCTNLGDMYARGGRLPQDWARANQLFEQSCVGGDARGCSNLGVGYEHGKGASQDLARAVQLYEKSCDAADPTGCMNLGMMLEKGRGVPQDSVRALQLYQRSCDAGEAHACGGLGFIYEKGRGVSQDFSRATQLYEQACIGGSSLGCTNLGVMYEFGKGVSRDLGRAVRLYEQGCDGDEPLGCTHLGVMYEQGRGVTQDLARATRLFRQGCGGGIAEGCERAKAIQPGTR